MKEKTKVFKQSILPNKSTLRNTEVNDNYGDKLRDFILGGQDGLVNVLGLVLAVASATNSVNVVFIASLAALFSESISMGAVAYTSQKTSNEYFQKELARKTKLIETQPKIQKEIVRTIYKEKGFSSVQLEEITSVLTSNKQVWLNTLMKEELNLSYTKEDPFTSALMVGISAVVGSAIPIIPFLFAPVSIAMWYSLIISIITLFVAGAIKSKLTIGNWVRGGIELAIIGTASAILGFVIGKSLSMV